MEKIIIQQSEALKALGTQGISTEAIEGLLEDISEAQDQVALGDQATWDTLEELRSFWGEKLQKLQAYLVG